MSGLLIFLFVYTAINKLKNHSEFIYTLRQSPLLAKFAAPVSWLIPLVELLISISLLFPERRKSGFLFYGILMSAFTLYVGFMFLFTPNLPCTCGGIITQLNWNEHLLVNISFTAIAFIGFKISKPSKFLLQ